MTLPGPPDGTDHLRTTEVFDNDSVPEGLLRAHRIADGVWGRLLVHTGGLRFVFEDQSERPIVVHAGGGILIPPGRPHHLEIDQPVTFAIEFHRLRSPRR